LAPITGDAAGGEHEAGAVQRHARFRAVRHRGDCTVGGAVRIVLQRASRQVVMRAVAERLRSGLFATAEDDVFVGFGLERNGFEFRADMGVVAERLVARATAAAPQITLARFDFVIEAFAVCDPRRGHELCRPYGMN